MDPIIPSNIPVVDFRRQSMVLEWHTASGTWTACAEPPVLVHGIALIRASQPNICVFGKDDRLHLQIGSDQYPLLETLPRIRWRRGWASFGLRRLFTVESGASGVLFRHTCWTGQADGFFSWFVSRAADPQWRMANGRRWSEGVEPAVLRSS
ncbi:MAG: hypothetical protein M3O41_00560 [Pseudomonadota bacterium]|nr:hypothetical protein [Pseudomonadota bacterium]